MGLESGNEYPGMGICLVNDQGDDRRMNTILALQGSACTKKLV
jgi:hypothetical protein